LKVKRLEGELAKERSQREAGMKKLEKELKRTIASTFQQEVRDAKK